MASHRCLLAAAMFIVCPSLGGCQEAWEDRAPTKQPPTRGQDFQRCAAAALPQVIDLAPTSSSWFSRTGFWADDMGAERGHWEQNRFRIDYNNLDYYVDLKPWFHAKVLRNEDLELRHMGIHLPAPRKCTNCPPASSVFLPAPAPREYADPIAPLSARSPYWPNMTTVVYMDCLGVPMYISRHFKVPMRSSIANDVFRRMGDEFEIFNHLGQLVATGGPSEMYPGQLYFKDDKWTAFAIAASPTVAEAATGHQEWQPRRDLYDFDHWQVWFMDGFNSGSYLKEPDNRWVIAAVVQEHAILQTTYFDKYPAAGALGTSIPWQYIVFIGLTLAATLGGVCLCLLSLRCVYTVVYPPKKKQKGNPFLVEDIGGPPYGSMQTRRGQREASP